MNLSRSFQLMVSLIICSLSGVACAQQEAAQENKFEQEMLTLPVRIVDPDGEPVAGAKVVPWALRCSQGHGVWSKKGFGASEPGTYTTDDQGLAAVQYPQYAVLAERVQTTQVSLSVDHPNFVYVMYGDANVPRENPEPFEIELQRGAAVELVPILRGKQMPTENLFAVWSDGRNWSETASSTTIENGVIKIPPMPEGQRQVMLVKLEGERATHFSSIHDLKLAEGVTQRESVEMRPAVVIRGRLDDEVPRPVKNGRVKAWTLPEDHGSDERSFTEWITWVPVAGDGSFTIDAWPAGEAVQLIALCDGHMATDGIAPEEVEEPRDPEKDPFNRPQVFRPDALKHKIVMPMTPLVRCEFQTIDTHGKSITGVEVESYPNVGWWNEGSQIYGWRLARSERMLRVRDFLKSIDEAYPQPFKTTTDAKGRGMLLLPAGKEELHVYHERYELPIDRGRRGIEVLLVAGKTTETVLKLQPKGTDYLGEWDKLAGVLFGCTGEECRRLLEDEGFRKRMESARKRYDKASNPQDPAMLSDMFEEIADAFAELDDEQAEVERWRKKAAEQKAKLQQRND